MHLGNVFSAMLSWLSAKSQGGDWLLRIEDIDPQRSRQEYADMLMDDLLWLGMTWDEGPSFKDFTPQYCENGPYYQSQRSAIYEKYLNILQEKGLIYPCYCTRADILATQAPHESDGRVVYKGTCRGLMSQEVPSDGIGHRAAALRMMVRDEVVTVLDGHYGTASVDMAKHVGDFIVRRKDGAWAYQLAVVVDDALMGVTEVVRGRDLLLSSPQQLYVADVLGFPHLSFTHLPLLCNKNGQRLSKRDKSLDMSVLREKYSAEDIIGHLAYIAGLTTEDAPCSIESLVSTFAWSKVPTQDITV